MLGFWASSGGGVEAWTGLTDTPGSITANAVSRGNSAGTALEFGGAYSTYLLTDGSRRINGPFLPDTDVTRNFGNASYRFRRMNVEALNAVGDENGLTRATNGAFSVVGGRNTGGGTNTLQIGGGGFPPVALFGNCYSNYANQTVTMTLSGGGSFMTGSAFAYYGANDTAEILCDAGSFASFTGGYAYPYFGSSNMTIRLRNQASGSFLWAYPAGNGNGTLHEVRAYANAPGSFCAGRTRGTGNADIHAGGNVGGEGASGGFVQGYVNASNATAQGILRVSGDGGFAQGNVIASTAAATSTIDAQGSGTFAQGTTLNAGSIISSGAGAFAQGRAASTAQILASANGAFAQGNATGSGGIYASGQGSLAHGRNTGTYTITASGLGAGAFGETAGASITATADNAFQFGPGANAAANSLQVGQTAALGTGLHFHAGGAPGAPVNGDMWVTAAGAVVIQSGGVACVCTNAVM
ncbi:MAG: hypothetical protein ACR2RF_10425 [Geminicoccaceae bacterium]